MTPINLREKFALFDDYWSPKIVGESNGSYVLLAKLRGEFLWHRHEHEDELFFVVKGTLVIRMRDCEVRLAEGEFFVVPKGVEHLPVAEEEVWVMLLEPITTKHTGDLNDERTVPTYQRL